MVSFHSWNRKRGFYQIVEKGINHGQIKVKYQNVHMKYIYIWNIHINGSAKDGSNFNADTLELHSLALSHPYVPWRSTRHLKSHVPQALCIATILFRLIILRFQYILQFCYKFVLRAKTFFTCAVWPVSGDVYISVHWFDMATSHMGVYLHIWF